MSAFFDAQKRSREDLQKQLQQLKDEGHDSIAFRNEAIAENTVAFEIGEFHAEGEKPVQDAEWLKGLVVSVRHDALVARMNSSAMLDRLDRVEKKVDRLQGLVIFTAALSAALGFKLLF